MSKYVSCLTGGEGGVHRVPRSRNPYFPVRSSAKRCFPTRRDHSTFFAALVEGSLYLVSKARNRPKIQREIYIRALQAAADKICDWVRGIRYTNLYKAIKRTFVRVVQAHSAQLNVNPRLFAELNAKFHGKLRVHILHSVSWVEAVRVRDCFKRMPAENVPRLSNCTPVMAG